jgi:outer membrane protein assembly factor BamB
MKYCIALVFIFSCYFFIACSKPDKPGPGAPGITPAGGNNKVVYIASENGKLYALDAGTGNEVWNFQLNTAGGRTAQFSSPAFAGGIIYVGSTDQNIYAVNASTGKEVWHYKTQSTPGFFYSSPVVADGTVFLPGYENRLYALDAASGVLRWSRDFPREFESSPAYFKNKLFITCKDGVLYGLNASTGNTLWLVGGSGYNWGFDYSISSPCVKDSVVYALTNDIANPTVILNELSTEDGSPHHGGYAAYSVASTSSYITSPAIDDSIVYFGVMEGSLYAVKNGDYMFFNKRWSFKTGGAIYSSPSFDDSTVYVGSNDGFLYAVNKFSGNLKWKFYGESIQIASSPVVSDGVVFVGGSNYVYALYAKDGTVKWQSAAGIPVSSSPCVITKQGAAIHGSVSGMKN